MSQNKNVHVSPCIAIVSSRDSISQHVAGQIQELIGNIASVEGYSLEIGLPPWHSFDVVVTATLELANMVASTIPAHVDLLVMKRTIWKDNWDKIMSIPVGTKALLVNDEHDTAVETITLLYELGATHVSLFPYYPGATKVSRMPLAITPGEVPLVPAWVKKVVDIDDRVIDVGTVMDIVTRIGCMDANIQHRLNQHMKVTMIRNYGLQEVLSSNTKFIFQIDSLLRWVNDGVIIYDIYGNIQKANDKALQILNMRFEDVYGENYTALFPPETFDVLDSPIHGTANKLVTIHNRKTIISKSALGTDDAVWLGIISLRELSKNDNKMTSLMKDTSENGFTAYYCFENIVGKSPAILKTMEMAKRFAKTNLSVLIEGESGTGKEVFAQAIHNASHRCIFPFVAINCAALPENLLESELFGYEGGSFTGALKGGKKGLLEQANKGTIFLDEIGDLSLNLQARLLRVLQERKVMRVGATKVVPIDIRVIVATNKNLLNMVKEGSFREDLYFRVNVLPLHVPSLRERKEDIVPLMNYFTKMIVPCEKGVKQAVSYTPEAIELLMSYSWPGNVRELENCMNYTSCMGVEQIDVHDLPEAIQHNLLLREAAKDIESPAENPNASPSLTSLEEAIVEILQELRDAGKTAGIGRRKLKQVLLEKGFTVTEYDVRMELERLGARHIVSTQKGRGGTTLIR